MPPKRRSPVMRDVARQVGVSLQTVSAVINGRPGITTETRERVLAAIDELGYHPHSVARSLRTRKTSTLAVVVSDIANPSFATLTSTAEEVACAAGYSVVIYNTHDDPEREARYIRTAAERWVDGVLFASVQDQMNSLAMLRQAGIPSVAIDRVPEGYVGPAVTLDNLKAGRLAAEHLLGLGHRRIGHISGPLELSLGRARQEGFRQAVEAMPGLHMLFAAGGGWECSCGHRAMGELLANEQAPTAVFAANDRMAIGAIRAAQENGLRIPEDLSVIGLDDIEVSAYLTPPLTTIRQDFGQIATMGIRMLLTILSGGEMPPEHVKLEPILIQRDSTAPPPSLSGS